MLIKFPSVFLGVEKKTAKAKVREFCPNYINIHIYLGIHSLRFSDEQAAYVLLKAKSDNSNAVSTTAEISVLVLY